MADEKPSSPAADTVPAGPDAAMDRVLEAEAEAREAIARCRKEAAGILSDGRRRARRIGERTDTRISALHVRCGEATHAALERLRREAPRETPYDLSEEQAGRLTRAAVDRVVARLLGEDTGGDGDDDAESTS